MCGTNGHSLKPQSAKQLLELGATYFEDRFVLPWPGVPLAACPWKLSNGLQIYAGARPSRI